VIAETEEELIKRLNEWKNNVDRKGMRGMKDHCRTLIGSHTLPFLILYNMADRWMQIRPILKPGAAW